LGRLGSVQVRGPAVIVVGPVAALGSSASGEDQVVEAQTARPLSGRTVVATRSGQRAAHLVRALQRAGAAVVELPLTRQVDAEDGGAALRAAAATVGSYAWLIATSVNAVDRFVAELRDARALAPLLVAALGPATADAFRMAGIEPDLVPAEHSARGLVEVFPTAATGTTRILFPCADIAPDTIVAGLAQKGWSVERVTAYRTVPVATPGPDVLAQVASADAVVFTATSSVRAFTNLRGPHGAAVAAPRHVVCIGPTTAEAARAAGMSGVHEAWGASTEGIVAELVHHFGRLRGDP
jgi:uroporphyrinogen III methyltransferase / synthase